MGAYCATRGISIVLGGFPDEKYLKLLLMHKEFNQVSMIFAGPAFIYLFSMTMTFILGVLFQSGALSCFSLDNENNEDEKEGKGKNNLNDNKDNDKGGKGNNEDEFFEEKNEKNFK